MPPDCERSHTKQHVKNGQVKHVDADYSERYKKQVAQAFQRLLSQLHPGGEDQSDRRRRRSVQHGCGGRLMAVMTIGHSHREHDQRAR